MALRFLYTQQNGVVAYVIAAPKASLEQILGPLTDEAYRAHVIERSIPPWAKDTVELPEDYELPTDRLGRVAALNKHIHLALTPQS